MESATPDVSIVIPCYNEGQRIGSTLVPSNAFLDSRPETFEILVVNDGSRDNTVQVVQEYAARMPRIHLLDTDRNQGKGAVVKRGMLAARGARVLFTDADLATPPEEIPNLLGELLQHAVAIGTRIHPDGTDMRAASQPPYRRFLGRVFSGLTALLVLRGFPDTQCGFKGFQRDAAQAIFSRVETTGIVFDVEVLAMAQVLGYDVAQLPIRWSEPGGSVMRVRAEKVKEVIAALLDIRARVARLRRQRPA